MPNRQFFTMKFKSSRLKEFDYNITLNFDEAKANGEIIALADNQILRSIRGIKEKYDNDYIKFDSQILELWYEGREKLRKRRNSEGNIKRIDELQNNINNMMFIPEYITIVMEHPSHYSYLFENGLKLNNKLYVRFSCSASQSRVSTVVFCESDMAEKLRLKFDNGRDLNKKLSPSKFNAYLGVSGSATKVVSTPNFCVVPDYKVNKEITVNFVTETDWNKDDHIEEKTITQEFNRFDGQGLISYKKAQEWATELGLGYVPAQWCIRQNYLKGMLCTFPIHEFCKTENKGNYIIDSLYKDQDGNSIKVNLKDVDVIVSESQFKLWDSFDNLETYKENCEKNGLTWGVSLYSPEEDKNILKMNYQFNQTLNWNKKDIEKVSQKFVDWISGVNSDNIYYTLLFLLGKNTTKEKIKKYLNSSENYWVKSLILNHELIKDKYFKRKIYDLIKKKIKNGCLGEILVDGNFQTLVSDPYSMMQHVCGQEVTGLLKENEYYSSYWNKKDVKVVDSMRAPLTYRSEHVKLNLVENEKINHWYRYCYTGVIINVFGQEVLHWAGSDWDYDQIATTSDSTAIKGVYKNELPVVYEPPKVDKIIITPESLYNADLFAFGSIIGSITNKSTSGYALLPLFEEDSKEYKTIMNRLKMCTKLQSAQIDKAKIGREVKGIPKSWVEYQKIKSDDSEEVKQDKEFYNSILLDKHPYFFIYLYKDTLNKYKKYRNGYNLSCLQKFKVSLDDLINKKRKTSEEKNFIETYYKYLPVIDSDCVMNNLCKYIESINFNIKEKLKMKDIEDFYTLYKHDGIVENEELYKVLFKEVKKFNKSIRDAGNMGIYNNNYNEKYNQDLGTEINSQYEEFRKTMNDLCSNIYELVNYLVRIFYVDYPSANKDLLWNTYGKYMFNNIKRKVKTPILFPIPDGNGDIEYLGFKYLLQEVSIE